MNKEMQKLLKAINDKKNEVKSLVKDGKLDKAREAKDELKELQEKFDLLFDLDEEEHEEIEGKVATGAAKTIGGKADKKNLVKAFVNIVKCGFLKREPDEGDVKVYKDALSTDTTKGDDDEMGIGVTVPEDIRTDIIELRRSEDNLEQYVNVEGVTTKSGSRNIEVDADSTPFDNVDEEADFPDMDEPKFKKIVYAIKKKGGILKITAELFEDTAANVMAYINKWIAKKTKATRNAMILKVADEMTKGKEVVISTIDSLKDVFNVGLDPAITTGAMVIANQNGYNYLDKLKDNGQDDEKFSEWQVIPEITITCSTGKVFINNITVEQYKKYAALMEKNGSDKITDALFFNKRIIQEIFGNRMSLDELGEVDVIEFLTASKGIHFIMQDIVSDALLNIVETEPIERETSAFDEYDRENGYEDEEQEEQNTWKICGEIVDRVTKIAIRLMRESYGQCMKENIIELLKYLKFELETVNENT